MLPLNCQHPCATREYDFQSVVTAASLIYGFAAGVPLAIYLTLGQYGARLALINCVCLYGYSLFVYIPAAVSNSDSRK